MQERDNELILKLNKLRKARNKTACVELMWGLYKSFTGCSNKTRLARLSRLVGKDEKGGIPQAAFYRWVLGFEQRAITEGLIGNETWETEVMGVLEGKEEMAHAVTQMSQIKSLPLSQVGEKMKVHAYRLLCAADSVTDVSSTLLMFYTQRMQTVITEAGGMHKLRAQDMALMQIYESKVEKYMTMMHEFLKPTAIQGYFRLIGLDKVDALPDGVEEGLMTPNKLLERLRELGVKHAWSDESNLEKLSVAYKLEDLDTIDAKQVTDEENHLGGRPVSKGEKTSVEDTSEDESKGEQLPKINEEEWED